MGTWYIAPGGRIRAHLESYHVMGYEDVDLRIQVDGVDVYMERDPTIVGMAVSPDGRLLFVQRRLQNGRRQKRTYDLQSREWLASLTHLILCDCGIGPDGAEALASARGWTDIRWLALADNPLGDSGVRSLGRASHWTFLRYLDLSRCGVGLEAARDLLYAPHFHYLETFVLSGNDLGPPGTSVTTGDRSSDLVRRMRRRTCAIHYTDGGRSRVVKSVR